MREQPSTAELIDAVAEFITREIAPTLSGRLAFHARVAANVLAIVARELELGPIPPEAELADAVAAKLAVANPKYFDVTPPP